MVTIITLIYVFFIALLLVIKKQINKEKLKNTVLKLKPCIKSPIFFCSLKSVKHLVFSSLKQRIFVFKSKTQLNKYVNPLKNIGVDYKKPIYKLELYKTFNWKEKEKEIEILKNFSAYGKEFYLFVFADKIENVNKVKNFLTKIDFNKNIFVYFCLDINYKLLSSINYFDANNFNKSLCHEKNMGLKNSPNEALKFARVNSSKKHSVKNKANTSGFRGGFNFELGSKIIFSNFVFNENSLIFEKQIGGAKLALTSAYNYNLGLEIYKLNINSANQNLNLKFCYFYPFSQIPNQNCLNILSTKHKNLFFQNDNSNEFVLFSNFFTAHKLWKEGALFYKKIKVEQNKSATFYFVKYLNKNPQKDFSKSNLESLFESTLNLYKNLKKIRVLSCNKTLNYLINNLLPQKIIWEQLINSSEISEDFKNFVEFNYCENLVQKDLISVPLYKFNLINSNIFKVYFNLVYFYFGVWKTGENTLVLNQDKSLILKDASVVFSVEDKPFFVEHKKIDLENEVKINNVSYTNLKTLNCNNILKNGNTKLEISF